MAFTFGPGCCNPPTQDAHAARGDTFFTLDRKIRLTAEIAIGVLFILGSALILQGNSVIDLGAQFTAFAEAATVPACIAGGLGAALMLDGYRILRQQAPPRETQVCPPDVLSLQIQHLEGQLAALESNKSMAEQAVEYNQQVVTREARSCQTIQTTLSDQSTQLDLLRETYSSEIPKFKALQDTIYSAKQEQYDRFALAQDELNEAQKKCDLIRHQLKEATQRQIRIARLSRTSPSAQNQQHAISAFQECEHLQAAKREAIRCLEKAQLKAHFVSMNPTHDLFCGTDCAYCDFNTSFPEFVRLRASIENLKNRGKQERSSHEMAIQRLNRAHTKLQGINSQIAEMHKAIAILRNNSLGQTATTSARGNQTPEVLT